MEVYWNPYEAARPRATLPRAIADSHRASRAPCPEQDAEIGPVDDAVVVQVSKA
jgi:hypothetical protein